ncbi:hypothetical protein ACLB2K_004926 [Fragaria x ananassa]
MPFSTYPQFGKHPFLPLNKVDDQSLELFLLLLYSGVNAIKVNRFQSELNVDVSLNEQNPDCSRHEIGKGISGTKRLSKREVGLRSSSRKSKWVRKLENVSVNDSEFDVDYSVIKSDMSLEHCNDILKRLERSSDIKTLKFFEWIRINGKLKCNVSAFNSVFRVLGRRENWVAAENLIQEMVTEFGCELNYQVFNTLIYACSKLGRVELGAKWFAMMLEYGVQPNVATFGMLMGLYQKGWNVEEAEFTFSRMRNFGIVCQSAYSAMITIYTRMSLYDRAEEIIGLMKEDGVIPNLDNWLVVINAYCQQGKVESAELGVVSMKEAGFSPNIVAYNTLITGYGKASKMDAAHHLFLGIKKIGLEPDDTTYHSMIEGWGRTDNYKEAYWYYKELKRLGYKPNSSNLYTLINLQAKHEDENGAIRTLDDMQKIGCQYSSILCRTSCSSLVMSYVKHGLVDDTMEVLREKQWKDPLFEDNLYHLLICSCKELGHLENAVTIYNQMPKHDGKPNMHIMCTMIDIYSIMDLFSEAEKVYLELESSGIVLDMIAYGIAVRMYVKAGSLEDACSVLDLMEKQEGLVPDIYMLRDMFRIYQKCGRLDKLKELYYRILKTRVTWDQEMYNCVINCCSRALPIDEISEMFDQMLKRGFVPNTITVNVMLDVYGKAKLLKKAKKLFLMAQKWDLVDTISYNTIIAAYGRNKDFKSMSSAVREMQLNGFSISLEAYNSMLDAYGKENQMEQFRSVLQKMKETSCGSDHHTYNTMINIYGEQGWIYEVAGVLTELKECGLGPDLCSYNTLIKAYGIAGMVEDAVYLLKEMRENGVEADKITYINLIAALRKNDEYLEAVKWSLWMKQMGL